jgi:hypothetical protein
MKFQKNSLVKPPEKVTMVNIMNPKEFENKDNEDYIEFSLVVEEVSGDSLIELHKEVIAVFEKF